MRTHSTELANTVVFLLSEALEEAILQVDLESVRLILNPAKAAMAQVLKQRICFLLEWIDLEKLPLDLIIRAAHATIEQIYPSMPESAVQSALKSFLGF